MHLRRSPPSASEAAQGGVHARKYNPVIGAFHARLVPRGKTFKRATTTRMRKLLMLMGTLVARGQLWDPAHAT